MSDLVTVMGGKLSVLSISLDWILAKIIALIGIFSLSLLLNN